MGSKVGSKLFPFLWYSNEAEEAARFYPSIFPDSRVDRVQNAYNSSADTAAEAAGDNRE